MENERPDLSQLDPAVRAYIEGLEAELAQLRESAGAAARPPLEPAEPPSPFYVITASRSGLAKRTPRHLYERQRRGGMGIFDLETPEEDPPTFLAVAEEGQSLLVITSRARAFRAPIDSLPSSPVRARGQSLLAGLPLESDERLAVLLPEIGKGYLALLGERGHVRLLRHHYLGENLKPGTALYSYKDYGAPVAGCWTPGDGDLFIVTRNGMAIRFAEKQVPLPGGAGIRLEAGDAPVAVTAVQDESGVFLLSADGKGTIRLMPGFNPNKSSGGGGKTALRAGQVVGAVTAGEGDDLVIVSRLSKIIRFRADEVPAKEGVVQGVNCMSLRADEAQAVAVLPPLP